MPDWAKLKVVDLKAELKQRDLPQHGLKAELVARLDDADTEAASDGDKVPTNERESNLTLPAQSDEQGADQTEPAPAAAEIITEVVPETLPEFPNIEATDDASVNMDDAVDVPTAAPVTPTEQPLKAAESSSDESQKRKRKSASPSPSSDEIATKRARVTLEPEENQTAFMPAASTPNTDLRAASSPIPMAVDLQTATVVSNEPVEPPPASPPPTLHASEAATVSSNGPAAAAVGDEMVLDHDVAPARHPATPALYISNLMRPLRPADIQAHVCDLAAQPGQSPDDRVIVQFHLDQIRTHAFVVLTSAQAASRVRSRLHDRVWPNESNRKALIVDFVPPDKVMEWIETEQSGGGGRGRWTTRWEVVYSNGPDGDVEARLQQADGPVTRPGPPPPAGPQASYAGANPVASIIPTGPRGGRDRGDRDGHSPRGAAPQPPPRGPRSRPGPGSSLEYDAQRTRARPSVTFQLVAPDLARRRVDNMRSFYTTDKRRELGREINRYSFEEGDGFVDRGKEVFEGIRPPHRERERRGGRGGGGGVGGVGGGGFRQRSDRYLPASSGGGGGSGGGRRWYDNRDRDRRY